jgi:hypothetical protein
MNELNEDVFWYLIDSGVKPSQAIYIASLSNIGNLGTNGIDILGILATDPTGMNILPNNALGMNVTDFAQLANWLGTVEGTTWSANVINTSGLGNIIVPTKLDPNKPGEYLDIDPLDPTTFRTLDIKNPAERTQALQMFKGGIGENGSQFQNMLLEYPEQVRMRDVRVQTPGTMRYTDQNGNLVEAPYRGAQETKVIGEALINGINARNQANYYAPFEQQKSDILNSGGTFNQKFQSIADLSGNYNQYGMNLAEPVAWQRTYQDVINSMTPEEQTQMTAEASVANSEAMAPYRAWQDYQLRGGQRDFQEWQKVGMPSSPPESSQVSYARAVPAVNAGNMQEYLKGDYANVYGEYLKQGGATGTPESNAAEWQSFLKQYPFLTKYKELSPRQRGYYSSTLRPPTEFLNTR